MVVQSIPTSLVQAFLFGLVSIISVLMSYMASPYLGIFFTIILVFLCKNRAILFSSSLSVLVLGNIFSAFASAEGVDSFSVYLIRGFDLIFFFSVFIYLLFTRRIFITISIYLAMMVVGFFFLYGMSRFGFSESVRFFRLFSYPILIFCIIDYCVVRENVRFQIFLAGIFGWVLCLLSIALYFLSDYFSKNFLELNNFLSFKYGFSTTVEFMYTTPFLNSNLFQDFDVTRFFGTVIHPITAAYMLVGYAIYFAYVGNNLISFLVFSLSFLCYSKAALVLGFTFYLFYFLSFILREDCWRKLFYIYCLVFVAGAIGYGMLANDPHVYTLLSSLQGIPSRIVGEGLGWGGALAGKQFGDFDLSSVTGDSAVASALDMLGVFGILVMVTIVKRAGLNIDKVGLFSIPLVMALILSIYQEEPLLVYSIFLLYFVHRVSTFQRGGYVKFKE